MTAPGVAAVGRPQTFSTKVVLALVLVGVLAFAGFAVLSAYAPELREEGGPGAHALSRSAVGYAAVRALLEEQGVDQWVSRSKSPDRPRSDGVSVLVLTPPPRAAPKDLAPFLKHQPLLIVLPKWQAAPNPVRPDFVRKAGVLPPLASVRMLSEIAPGATIAHRNGRSKPQLSGGGYVFNSATRVPLGEIDTLQTIAAPGLTNALVDEHGRAVLACRTEAGVVCILSDPDLLNTHGLRSRLTAGAGLAILNELRDADGAVVFDVTLNGIQAERSLLKLLFTPPLLSFTLCAVAAALLMGWHAMARFGPTARQDRALALGKQALVDNSAGLFRMAHKEHELAPAYVRLVEQQAARAAGGERAPQAEADRTAWLDRIGAARGVRISLSALDQQAHAARTRHDLLALARRLHEWRSEMMRERR